MWDLIGQFDEVDLYIALMMIHDDSDDEKE